MLRRLSLLAALVLMLGVPLWTFGGCGAAGDGSESHGGVSAARSPGELGERFRTAFRTRDAAALRACFDRSTKEGVAVGNLLAMNFEIERAEREFLDTVKMKLGADCLPCLGLPEPSRLVQDMDRLVQQAEVRVEGQMTSLVVPKSEQPGQALLPDRMIEKDSWWYLQVPDSLKKMTASFDKTRDLLQTQVWFFEQGKSAAESAATVKDLSVRLDELRNALNKKQAALLGPSSEDSR
jgi:hypothetical protein